METMLTSRVTGALQQQPPKLKIPAELVTAMARCRMVAWVALILILLHIWWPGLHNPPKPLFEGSLFGNDELSE